MYHANLSLVPDFLYCGECKTGPDLDLTAQSIKLV